MEVEKTFILDAKALKKQNTGSFQLPIGKEYTKMVIDLELQEAASIETLDMLYNPVKTDIGSEKLAGIKILKSDNCKLDIVPGWIAELENVEEIHLWKNDLKEVPS